MGGELRGGGLELGLVIAGLVKLLLGIDREVGALGEELADEAVSVLVRAPLPW